MSNTENIFLSISKDIAMHYRIVPFQLGTQGQLICYGDKQLDLGSLKSELDVVLDKEIDLVGIDEKELTRLLSTHYLSERKENNHDLGVISSNDNFLNTLINEAKKLKSSDIHIERFEKNARVRVRIDGMMIERYQINREDYPALINKIKIMAHLDIAEKRLPQDGRIQFKSGSDGNMDIRVSILPTLHGEKAVLRLLNNNSANLDLQTMGLSELDLSNYMEGIKRPNGIILISGPTGSGKTTTLYATLKLLNKTTRNILTIEDPIEYTLEGINQVQLKESIGLGFASALRTFLRQDPDVIMVGEIRDVDTADMAIRAALTGHLVLSTIHTNSAWGTVSRLMDMGIPGFLIANTLNTSVAQRLVRLLCPFCKTEEPISSALFPKHFAPPASIQLHHGPKGCDKCFYTGYKGRKAVYEVIPIDLELSEEIKKENTNISQVLAEKGIQTLSNNAFSLFTQGLTSLEEIYPLLLSI